MAKKRARKKSGIRQQKPESRTTYSLSVHAQYQCGSSGICCLAFPIPIDDARAEQTGRWIEDGDLTHRGEQPFTGKDGNRKIAKTVTGACGFLNDENRCDVHARKGHQALPDVCRRFPRFAVIDPSSTSVSLSNFCPTAAGLLFTAQGPARRAVNPPAFPSALDYGGLDARELRPPMLSPRVRLTWAGYRAWEDFILDVLAVEGLSAEGALLYLLTAAERLRTWETGSSMPTSAMEEARRTMTDIDVGAMERALSGLPSGLHEGPRHLDTIAQQISSPPPAFLSLIQRGRERYGDGGASFTTDYARYGASLLRDCNAIVCRYLATKLFANIFAYKGSGLRSGLAAGAFAITSLRVLTTLTALEEGRMAMPGDLKEAMRITDYAMLHVNLGAYLLPGFNQTEQMDLRSLIAPLIT